MNYLDVLMSLKQNIQKFRHEFKSKIYSFVIVEGVDCFMMLMIKGTMIVYMNLQYREQDMN